MQDNIKCLLNKCKSMQFSDARAALEFVFEQACVLGISFVVRRDSRRSALVFTFLPEVAVTTAGIQFKPTAENSFEVTAKLNGHSGFYSFLGAKTIAVVGPDGSGKTSLINAVKRSDLAGSFRFKRFKRYFRRFLPYLFRQQDRNTREQKLLQFILPLAWLTFALGAIVFRAKRVTVLDRYFYDYFLRQDLNTGGNYGLIRNYKFWTKNTPRPKKLLVAMCAPEIVHGRKQEMSLATISSIYKIYIDQIIYADVPAVLFCNTALDEAVSCQQAVDFLAS